MRPWLQLSAALGILVGTLAGCAVYDRAEFNRRVAERDGALTADSERDGDVQQPPGDGAPLDANDVLAPDAGDVVATDVLPPPADGTCNGTVCGSSCVDLDRNPMHCGRCGNACPGGAHATPICTGGRCALQCWDTFDDCDTVPGCETDFSLATSCGDCRAMCGAGSPVCSRRNSTDDYDCRSACEPGTTMCGTTCTDLTGSLVHCGACGTACPAAPNATPTCMGGTCSFTCLSGMANCNGSTADGCETDVRASIVDCGRCGNVCPNGPNGARVCRLGTCGFVCTAPYGDCDGIAATGCETDTTTAASHCGACGRRCTPTNGTGGCVGGSCMLTCNPGFGDCNSSGTDGCEANFATAPAHCGGCGRACPTAPNMVATCSAGRCGLSCSGGFANCNGLMADGCEVNITTPTNCGVCGRVCTPAANASAACGAGGACGFTCTVGFGNCNAVATDGCESNFSSDARNCGRCGNICPDGTCVAGVC